MLGFTHEFNPQPKEITQKFFPEHAFDIHTPAFKKKKGYTNYQEMMQFIDSLKIQHPNLLSIQFIGESQLGKKIPMVLLSNANGKEKLKVWFQGGLHGNEMASTECVLYLMEQVLADPKLIYLLDKIDLMVVPMANIDGYEKQDRYAANGLDLNRDQTKLNIKESIFLKQSFSDFNPHVAIDFHEYNPFRKDFTQLGNYGVTSRYDVMFMSSGNLNVPEVLRNYTNHTFVAQAQASLSKIGLSFEEYITSEKESGELHFNQGSNSARSSATSYALANTISSLIEIRGVGIERTSFKRRIFTGYTIGLSYLQTAYQHFDEVKDVLAKASTEKKAAVVSSAKESSLQAKKFISLENNEEITLDVLVNNASKSKAVLTREYPQAYVLEKGFPNIVQRLQVLGIKIDSFATDTSLWVDAYRIKTYQLSSQAYEGVYQQKVSAELVSEKVQFKQGTLLVFMNQENANLAIEVLEPEAPNSFVLNHVLPVSAGQKLPIYRYVLK